MQISINLETKNTMKLSFYLFPIFCLLISCNQLTRLNSIPDRFEKKDLAIFDDISITHRSTDVTNNNVYFLAKANKNCRPYIVEYRDNSNEIGSIDDKLFRKSKNSNSCKISKDSIKQIFETFIELDIQSIAKDSLGLFIKPKNNESSNVFWRPVNSIKDSVRIRGENYRKIENNWYVSYD